MYLVAMASPAVAPGPVGKIRSPLVVILLSLITLGIYTIYWFYRVFDDLKAREGVGIGGIIGLVIALVVAPVNWFVLPSEVGALYERAGRPKPVSGITGLWFLLPLVGAIVWVYKVQGAMNRVWAGQI
jgi:hypothetical protein